MVVRLNKKPSLRFLILLMIAIALVVIAISNSDLFCRAQPTKLAALRDFPGKLGSLSEKDVQKVQILQQASVADGVSVRVTWSDGLVSYAGIQKGSFLPVCMANVQARQVNLLDREGNSIATENLEYK